MLAIAVGAFFPPDAEILSAAIAAASPRIISAVSALEASIVIESKKGEAGLALLDELLSIAQFEIASFDDERQRIARAAYRRYGKGHHPAGLNFGDCCAYALAKARNETLLFKGNDFNQTDIATASLVPAH
ncbi:MAG: type II toxin-antitoxin system VapC family toxin [Nitrosomonadales bacterium]|nr:type II toxin-antitoxin system VapC family toxin [Nitrosomonadales bacterium]